MQSVLAGFITGPFLCALKIAQRLLAHRVDRDEYKILGKHFGAFEVRFLTVVHSPIHSQTHDKGQTVHIVGSSPLGGLTVCYRMLNKN